MIHFRIHPVVSLFSPLLLFEFRHLVRVREAFTLVASPVSPLTDNPLFLPHITSKGCVKEEPRVLEGNERPFQLFAGAGIPGGGLWEGCKPRRATRR